MELSLRASSTRRVTLLFFFGTLNAPTKKRGSAKGRNNSWSTIRSDGKRDERFCDWHCKAGSEEKSLVNADGSVIHDMASRNSADDGQFRSFAKRIRSAMSIAEDEISSKGMQDRLAGTRSSSMNMPELAYVHSIPDMCTSHDGSTHGSDELGSPRSKSSDQRTVRVSCVAQPHRVIGGGSGGRSVATAGGSSRTRVQNSCVASGSTRAPSSYVG